VDERTNYVCKLTAFPLNWKDNIKVDFSGKRCELDLNRLIIVSSFVFSLVPVMSL
jgi:hypothetical protein